MALVQLSSTTQRILRQIALAAGLFALVISVMVTVNYFQLKRSDPLNAPSMKVLLERLNNNPEDEKVRAEIRELDLLARRAFFTSQWQIRTGGLLLLICLLIVVACLKAIEILSVNLPVKPGEGKTAFWDDQLLNRRWIAIAGIALVIGGLVFAALSQDHLGKYLERAPLAKSPPGSPGSPVSIEKGDLSTLATDSVISADSLITNEIAAFPDQKEINSNFPYFRGPLGSGIAFRKNIPVQWDGRSGQHIRWKAAIPLPGYNSPVVWNDKVFMSGANDKRREVYCFSVTDGRLLWNTPVEKIQGSPVQAPKVLGETGFAAPTLATDGRRVYAIFANGDLIALDMDGKKVWDKNMGIPKNHYGHSSSLILFRDLLIVQYDQTGNASVMALNATTGAIAWKTAREVKVSWSSPVLVNTGTRVELILVAEPYMISYDPSNGKEYWRIDCISGEVGPSVAYANGIAYSVNDYSKLAAVKVGSPPALLWENDEYLSDIPSPVAAGKYLLLPTSYGTMVCYDAMDGTKYWEKDYGTSTYASPIFVDGKVFQLDKKGIMHIFRPDKTYVPVAECQLGEGSVCTPAFLDGLVFIRGDKNLYCIEK